MFVLGQNIRIFGRIRHSSRYNEKKMFESESMNHPQFMLHSVGIHGATSKSSITTTYLLNLFEFQNISITFGFLENINIAKNIPI